jgi:RNA polymerase sigma-70 factor (ECF subfamily)
VKYSRITQANIFSESGNKTGDCAIYAMEVPDQPLPTATFEDLALPLFDQLYNFAHWLTQNTTEAEDLVQETYAKALRGFPSFQTGTNFRAWMYRILRNSFLSSKSGLKETVSFDEEDVTTDALSSQNTPETLLLAQADRAMVQEALGEMAVSYREILLLCELEEMSYQEIAQTLAIPIGTVMSRLSRARKALRELLQAKIQGGRHVV